MKILHNRKKTKYFGVLGLLLGATVLWVWQYLVYTEETRYLNKWIAEVEKVYVHDYLKLSTITKEKIASRLKDTENKIVRLHSILPPVSKDVTTGFINTMNDINRRNQVEFDTIKVSGISRDFFQETDIWFKLSGKEKDILRVLSKIEDRKRLCSWKEICRNHEADQNAGISIMVRLACFAYVPGPESVKKKNRRKKARTWLPPYSMWIKDLRHRRDQLEQLKSERVEFNQKKGEFDRYTKRLQHLLVIEKIVEHLNRRRKSLMDALKARTVCPDGTPNRQS
jgi:hypothetical protein